jgi:hypothetical protein
MNQASVHRALSKVGMIKLFESRHVQQQHCPPEGPGGNQSSSKTRTGTASRFWLIRFQIVSSDNLIGLGWRLIIGDVRNYPVWNWNSQCFQPKEAVLARGSYFGLWATA